MKKLINLFVIFVLLNTNLFSQGCLPDGITFTTQEQIDNFQINFPNCYEIEGDVTISGFDITNLTGLENLTSIGGKLFFYYTLNLTSLNGLGNLSSIGEFLGVYYADALTSFSGLENLTTIGSTLEISENNSLTSLVGLENLTSIGIGLLIEWNDVLTSLDGLDNLNSVGHITVASNDALISLSGLESLSLISGYLSIWHSPALISLSGLENVTTIDGRVDINDNDALISLSNLENLTSIGGWLHLSDNNSLTTLTGLENIDKGSITDLYIYNNNLLSFCEVKSVCDYLTSPNGIIEIYNNAQGCNSQQQVEDACDALGIDENKLKFEFSIYPNPASNEIFIESNNGVNINEVNIYNTIGQIVLSDKIVSNKIDISRLNRGLYFVELVSNEMRIREKLIVK